MTRKPSRAPAITVKQCLQVFELAGFLGRSGRRRRCSWGWKIIATLVRESRAQRRQDQRVQAGVLWRVMQQHDGQCSGGQAAGSKAAQYQPVDRRATIVDPATDRLSDRGGQQIGPDGSVQRGADQEYDKRRPQRPATTANGPTKSIPFFVGQDLVGRSASADATCE